MRESETCWANSSGGFEGPETFFFGFVHLFSSLLFFIFSLLFHLSLHLSCFFSLLVSLSLDLLFFYLPSSPFSPLSSSLSLSRLFLSRIVLSCLSFSVSLCLSLFLSLSLSVSLFLSLLLSSFSVSLCLCLSLSLCLSVSVSVLCGVCVVLWCVLVCVVLWCVVMCGCVWCGVPVCTFKTPPCVGSKRPRVYRHHAHMCYHMRAWCRYTRGRLESTHGDVFHRVKHVILTFLEHLKRMLGSSLIDNFLLTMNGPYGLSRASEVHQRNP